MLPEYNPGGLIYIIQACWCCAPPCQLVGSPSQWQSSTLTLHPHFYIYLILSYSGTLISRAGWEKWHCSISGTEQGRESRQKAGKTVKRGTSEENLFNTSFLPPHPQTPVQSWTHLCILLFFLNLFKINCILFLFWIFLHSIVLNCKKRSSQINVAPWKE